MTLVPLSEEQRMAALEKARVARAKRMEFKKQLKAGELSLEEVFDSEDEIIRKTRIKDVLKALPKVGDAKARQALEEIGIQENRRIGGLGVNQKKALLVKFGK